MVKVNYGALQTMSSTTSSASQARVAGYKQLINAFSTFSGSYELQGDGYDAARTYASGIMVSYYQACILYSEAVADAADYLAYTYTALCGSESLDEEELQTEINNATRGSMQVSSSIASFERRDKLTDTQKASLESLRKQASELDEQIRVATEKLEHLRAFDTASASACTAANDATATIASAEHTLGVSFGARTFECTTSTDWATTVATKWEARAVNLQESYDKALQKLYNGEELTESDLTAIERYNSEYPGVVDQEILQYTKEVRSLKAEEMRYRVVVDKVIEGKQLTSDERKFAKEFAAKYPDLEINKVILSTVERQENYKKIIEKANKGKELNAGELDFLINYYKDYPDVSVPKSVSKSLKNRKFENKISQSSLANLEESYGYAVKDYERYLNTGQYVYTKGGVTLQEAAYIYRVYNLKKSSGEDTLQERTDKKKMFANLRASDKKKIDSKTLAELSSEHIEFMTGRTSIEFDYIIGSDADKAKKDYEYYRFNELMKKQPIDWRDPDYMNKRNQYILKTGKNPSTGEKATKDEIFVAKNYGWVKGTTDVATATIDLLDNLGIFQLAMTKISRPKIDTSKIVKEINISDTATVPNTHTDVKIPKLKPAKTVDLEVPVKPKVDVKVPKIKPVEAVAGTTTMVPKSKKPDIDVLTKPKDLSTIKGEAVDHIGTAKPKVDLDVPEAGDVLKVHEAEISPTKSEMKKGSKQKEVHVEDVEHYTTWDQMKAEHYRTVTDFVQANKPDGASHPREWLNKPNHEFTIEHMSDGTQVWKYKDSLGVEKVYVDGVLQGGGVPNPKVTQHFEQLNPRIKDFDPEVASTLQKSNAGEILADDNMRIVRENVGANGNTYTLESIGRPAPGGIDDPIVKGIDGIYRNQTPPPSYVINETKWGSSEINQHTKSGPQMSEQWVRDRINALDGAEKFKLKEALDDGDVEFVISKVDTSGNVSTYYAEEITDSTGRIVKVKPGTAWP